MIEVIGPSCATCLKLELAVAELETALRDLKSRLGFRRFVVRNQARLDLLFALMALDLRKEAGERTFPRVLRRLVEANGGSLVLGRRTLDDRKGSSLHAAVVAVEQRLAPKRALNRAHAAAARQRQQAAAVPSSRSSAPAA